MKRILLILSIFLLFTACRRPSHFDDRASLLSYIENPQNGLLQEIKLANGMVLNAYFLPAALLLGSDIKSNTSLNDKIYLVLGFSLNNKELLAQLDAQTYGTIIQTMSFNMEQFLHITLDTDESIESLGVFFQPTYNMSQRNNLFVVMNKAKLYKSKKITIRLEEFGLGIGEQDFEFKTGDVKYITSVLIKNID
ncbi:hypothetical protein FAZ15_16160 [Sphingobacterium olei]|uniref:Lipoprotein n=1 Tax=Sphingobacterium olei TaxID=2571155 RepID=A0A4U0NHV8_9SPHI|nr:hypothetical protein [Sphingobacterium olei]TJZ53573.1 hypothetical protein FAZ15_16160 [Sphingobacterium olei]